MCTANYHPPRPPRTLVFWLWFSLAKYFCFLGSSQHSLVVHCYPCEFLRLAAVCICCLSCFWFPLWFTGFCICVFRFWHWFRFTFTDIFNLCFGAMIFFCLFFAFCWCFYVWFTFKLFLGKFARFFCYFLYCAFLVWSLSSAFSGSFSLLWVLFLLLILLPLFFLRGVGGEQLSFSKFLWML